MNLVGFFFQVDARQAGNREESLGCCLFAEFRDCLRQQRCSAAAAGS